MPPLRRHHCLSALLVGLLLVGCDVLKSDTPIRSTEDSLLPLAIGNEWVLRSRSFDSPRYDTMRVVGQANAAGRSYFVVRDIPRAQTAYLRADGLGRIYRFEDGNEHVWLDPTVVEGTYSYRTYSVEVRRGVTVETPVGTFQNGIRFFFDDPRFVDDEHTYTLVPGIGIASQGNAFFFWTLTSYDVNQK